MSIKLTLAATAACLLTFSSAQAGSHAMIDKAVEADLQVTEWVDQIMDAGFDATQRNMLKSVGHQLSIARSCEGFKVDNAKTDAVIAQVIEGHSKEDADYDDVQAIMMMSLGAFMAAGITAHAMDPEGFCADAAAEREAAEDGAAHIIWASM